MFNRNAYDNARPNGIAVFEIQIAEEERTGQRMFVPLQRSELRGEIVGPLADLHLTQVFRFSRSELDKVIEAVYRFPLPGDAAVQGVRVRFGDVEIQTELRERGDAEKEYAEAKAAGRQAALMTRESPDVFTLAVAGIRPDEDVTVDIHYVQLARPEGDFWTLRAPLTTAPRYVRSDEVTGRHAHGQPLLVLRDPGHRFSLDLTLRGTDTVTSQTHALAVEPGPDALRIRLQDGEVLPDRDLALRWTWERDRAEPTLRVWTHRDDGDPWVYFLALVAPAAAPTCDVKPREIILLVDRSGSMSGAKWEAAQWAGSAFLNGLTSQDEFALCLFNHEQEWFAQELQTASERELKSAVSVLMDASAGGGTQLGVALEQALRLPRMNGEVARHVLVVTDALVADNGRILRLVDDETRQKEPRRVSALSIDAAPNSYLAREMADRSGGVARFLTSDPAESDITTALEEVLADWAAPLILDTRLEVDRPGAMSGRDSAMPAGRAGCSALALGDLPAGRPTWTVGRVPASETGALTFTVVGGGRVLAETRTKSVVDDTEPAIKALFGAQRLNHLEGLAYAGYGRKTLMATLARLGYADADIASQQEPALYAENARQAAARVVHPLLIRESLASGLPCGETAFVAVRREGEKVVAEVAVAIGNALPHGLSDRFTTSGVEVRALRTRLSMSAAPDSFTSIPRKRMQAFFQADTPPTTPVRTGLFSGTPRFSGGRAVLFDESAGQPNTSLADIVQFSGLAVEFPDGAPDAAALDRRLTLKLYVGDQVTPRATIRLADLVRAGGRRPLNIRRDTSETILLVLEDPNGAWDVSAPVLIVTLAGQGDTR